MGKRPNTAERALRKFQTECTESDLPLECALAQIALFALRLEDAHEQNVLQQFTTQIYHIRKEAANVRHALKLEYPELDWRQVPTPERQP